MGRARELPYVDDVTIFGNALHLLVRKDVSDERIARDLESGRRRARDACGRSRRASRTSSCA